MNETAQAVIEEAQEKAKQLPIVRGYKILCTLPNIESKFDSGIIKADSTVKYEELLSNVLFVVSLGDMAYGDGGMKPNEIALIKAWYFADPNIPDVWKYGNANTGIFKYKVSGKIITK